MNQQELRAYNEYQYILDFSRFLVDAGSLADTVLIKGKAV